MLLTLVWALLCHCLKDLTAVCCQPFGRNLHCLLYLYRFENVKQLFAHVACCAASSCGCWRAVALPGRSRSQTVVACGKCSGNENNCKGMPHVPALIISSKWLKAMKLSSYKVGVNVAVFLMPYMALTRRISVVFATDGGLGTK